ncbi:hypothetical protein VK70_08365 [Paenibacillus durus ATCC 35681]|uniref:Uncharacterized protein n=1 Tax=Paenibacillus durus ATCC 35681 TaxID=1333534 RepID=A0A0F7CHL4_PAEDU|nr:hypothetical protein VK70_08365 [Paenibacillus durus ATCC 35681]
MTKVYIYVHILSIYSMAYFVKQNRRQQAAGDKRIEENYRGSVSGKWRSSSFLEEMNATGMEYVRGIQAVKVFGVTAKFPLTFKRAAEKYRALLHASDLPTAKPAVDGGPGAVGFQ